MEMYLDPLHLYVKKRVTYSYCTSTTLLPILSSGLSSELLQSSEAHSSPGMYYNHILNYLIESITPLFKYYPVNYLKGNL